VHNSQLFDFFCQYMQQAMGADRLTAPADQQSRGNQMDKEFAGKVVIVTGAFSIGRATARDSQSPGSVAGCRQTKSALGEVSKK